jgi:hypothetical protein
MNMYDRTSRWLVVGLLAVSPYTLAQQSPPPAPAAAPAAPTRNVPRPDDLEPGVNTSAPAATAPSTTTTPSAAAPGPGTTSSRSSSAGAGASGPTDTSSSTAPKVGKSSAGKASAGGKSAANASGPAGTTASNTTATGTPGATSNSGVKGGKAEDRLQLDTTQITGNQELPKVLYIVPWKRSDLGDLLGKPANSLLDEVLEPVDRDVFKRENRYYDALKEDAAGGADKAAGAAGQGSGDKR